MDIKKHVSVDMQSDFTNKVAVTAANITDTKGFKHVCANKGAVYADKGYCVKLAKQVAANIHLAAMKEKNRDLDRFYTKISI